MALRIFFFWLNAHYFPQTDRNLTFPSLINPSPQFWSYVWSQVLSGENHQACTKRKPNRVLNESLKFREHRKDLFVFGI